MKRLLILLPAIILLVSCGSKQKAPVDPLEDSSDFVAITERIMKYHKRDLRKEKKENKE